MCKDWDKLAVNMRKGWNYRDTNILHSACGGYLYFMKLLHEKIPSAEFAKVEPGLKDQFMLGFLDPDIVHALETTAPPAPLDSVSFLRCHCAIESKTLFGYDHKIWADGVGLPQQ